jgi:hypothetical protein
MERHFRGAGYNDPAEDHRNHRWRGCGVACRVAAAGRCRGPDALTAQLGEALAGLRKRRPRHDPGRVLVDMAVAVADGAATISDVAVLADQAALFGPVASDSTCWRLLNQLDTTRLAAVASARAATREVVWAQRAELSGQAFPPATAAGRELPGLVIDLDASIVVCHSEKEQAAPTFKKTFG